MQWQLPHLANDCIVWPMKRPVNAIITSRSQPTTPRGSKYGHAIAGRTATSLVLLCCDSNQTILQRIISTRPPTCWCQFQFSHLCCSNHYIHTHARTHTHAHTEILVQSSRLVQRSRFTNAYNRPSWLPKKKKKKNPYNSCSIEFFIMHSIPTVRTIMVLIRFYFTTAPT